MKKNLQHFFEHAGYNKRPTLFSGYKRKSRFGLFISFALGLFTLIGINPKANAQFTAGRLVVLQVGDGSAALSNVSTPVFLKEFTTTGSAGISVSIPATGSTALTVSGSATSEGLITRSTDGASLILPGYNAVAGIASIATTSSASHPRAIGAVTANTTYSLATTTTSFSGGNARGAISDASNYWGSGSTTGIVLESSGAGIIVSSTVTNTRALNIFNGQLYFSTGSGTVGIYKVGTGLPVTVGNTSTLLISTTGSPYAFSFNENENVCYVADDGAGIKKFTYDGSAWSLAYILNSTNCRGLVVDYSGADANSGVGAILYATNTISPGSIFKVTDGGIAGASASTLVTAPTNTTFRGIAFAPQDLCLPPSTSDIAGSNSVCEGAGGIPYSVTNTAGSSYAWTITGGTQASGGNTNSITVDWDGPGAGNVSVIETNACGSIGSAVNLPITINSLPVVTCPGNFEVCLNDDPFSLTGGTPIGGIYSGTGVNAGEFSPTDAGAGTHTITYSYSDGNNCSAFCTFDITVNALPVVICSPDFTVDINDPPLALITATPPGGTYSGNGVNMNTFDPNAAGPGPQLINYIYTDVETGCTNVCTFTITVITEEPCTSTMEWVYLPPGTDIGSCPSMTNCCTNTICYGLQYTPANSGILEDYTTGFTVPCAGPNSPIISNTSCVMQDNSDEINGCGPPANAVLFNSSGFEGMISVTACVPLILHKVCFTIPIGESVSIAEDVITDLTTNIQVDPVTAVTEFPDYTTTALTRPLPDDPVDGSATVACIQNAVPPGYPEVLDYCGLPIPAVLTNTVDSPVSLTCEGTRVYTYTYSTCDTPPYIFTWDFTYTIEVNDFSLPGDGNLTVACPDDTDTPPVLPLVTDNCGNVLTPVGDPVISPKPTCDEDRTYLYTYVDCVGNTHVWTFTYHVVRNDFSIAPDGNGNVSCAGLAIAGNVILPPVFSDCGEVLTPGLPIQDYNETDTYEGCNGTISYTWIYSDCVGHAHPWTYTYTIERNDFTVPADGGITIPCPALIVPGSIIPPVVFSDCDEMLTPTGPVEDQFGNDTFDGCEGTVSFTWTYQDCAMHTQYWSFVYTIERNDFTLPSDGSLTVSCPDATDVSPIPPLVLDNCGELLLPSGPPVISPKPTCEGIRTYMYSYTDCEGHTHVWTFTYTVMRNDFSVPADEGGTVSCPGLAIPGNVMLPSVFSDCGEELTPAAPVQDYNEEDTYTGCDGTISYTWIYMDCANHAHPWTYTYTIERNDFIVPANQGTPVACPASAVPGPIQPPMVFSDCGEPILPTGPVQNQFSTDTYSGCEGTISFTWTYVDCALHTHYWTFTYTILRNDFTVPANQGTTVACPVNVVPGLIQPPMVFSDCGDPILPSGPIENQFATDTYTGCEGTISYTWTYVDCALHAHYWTFTYTILRNDFTVPANQSTTVACPVNAYSGSVLLPSVFSDCGEPLMPTGPVFNQFGTDTYAGCEGTISYTWTYTDCIGHSHPWTFTFIIVRNDFTVPSNQGTSVSCPQDAVPGPIQPPSVVSNCGEQLIPMGPVQNQFGTDTYTGCEGTISYTWTYKDCVLHTHYWTFTYTILRNEFMVPADQGLTVPCPFDAVPGPIQPPIVFSDCAEPIIPAGPVQNQFSTDTYMGCEGTISYTWTYEDCALHMHYWTFTYTIEREDFVLPPDGSGTVSCPSLATAEAVGLPVITTNCLEILTPAPPVQNYNETDSFDGCGGTISYTWLYTDCEGNMHPWTYTYTIERNDFTVPADGGITIPCPALIVPGSIIPPVVFSDCDEMLTPAGPVEDQFGNDTFDGCEGTVSFTWIYQDCALHTQYWSFVYTIERNDFTLPSDGSLTVSCPDATDVSPIPPLVLDNCDELLLPSGPPVISPKPTCEGIRTYMYTYTDCEGHTHVWTFTYTVMRNDFSVPADGGGTVSCPGLAIAGNVMLPSVFSDCSEELVPAAPVQDYNEEDTYSGCEGTISYTWIYTDCANHAHPWTYTFTILRNDFTVPANEGSTVSCPTDADAGLVMLPTVLSDCGEVITPSGPVQNQFATDTYNGCEGTISYTWTYIDCLLNTHTWTYTFSIIRHDFTLPMDGGGLVACISGATAGAVTLPQVISDCGEILIPGNPVQNQFNTDSFDGCEGTVSFTWTYADCSLHTHAWTYTYDVEHTAPTEADGPVPTMSIINCYLDAAPPTLPVIQDACGNLLTLSGPVVGGTNTGGCDGNITYTYSYTDCDGVEYDWVYTYTVSCDPVVLQVWLEGPYNTINHNMDLTLNSLHTLPGQNAPVFYIDYPAGQPYNLAPWNYSGVPNNTGTQWGDFSGQTPYPADVVDWVLVTIRKNGILPSDNIWTCAGWVLQNGEVTFPEDCPLPAFTTSDLYYFVVQHRNHLGIMSPAEVDMPCGTAILEWDFRNSNSYQPLFRFGQKEIEPGVWAMFAANGEQEGSIQAINSVDRTLWKILQGVFGYNSGDFSMDALTNSFDETLWKQNQNRTTGVIFY